MCAAQCSRVFIVQNDLCDISPAFCFLLILIVIKCCFSTEIILCVLIFCGFNLGAMCEMIIVKASDFNKFFVNCARYFRKTSLLFFDKHAFNLESIEFSMDLMR